ncbi:hypothetical protein [Duganella sp. CF458]|uniref:hypothetical protein n=1 Tax=Duganella sp. CF458 TaxID=1884368 RepID=UPI0011133C06|nr:hypothetical protein [Duganella sp. CF458]
MSAKFSFIFRGNWRWVHGALWVHLPVANAPGEFFPPAPPETSHKGFAVLNVAFDEYEFQFCSRAHIDHYIDVLSRKPLPTSRALSRLCGKDWGPNQHWLSRLPAKLKAPKNRARLVEVLIAARKFADEHAPNNAFQPAPQAQRN